MLKRTPSGARSCQSPSAAASTSACVAKVYELPCEGTISCASFTYQEAWLEKSSSLA